MYIDTLKVCVCVCVCERERERERASQAYIREVEKAEDEAQERKGPRDDEEYVRDECHNVAVTYCTVVVDECATGQHQYRHGWPSPQYHITSCTHFICSLSLSLSPLLSILHTCTCSPSPSPAPGLGLAVDGFCNTTN
jgi:hypothetical protein